MAGKLQTRVAATIKAVACLELNCLMITASHIRGCCADIANARRLLCRSR
jgi:hypothetical protein